MIIMNSSSLDWFLDAINNQSQNDENLNEGWRIFQIIWKETTEEWMKRPVRPAEGMVFIQDLLALTKVSGKNQFPWLFLTE